MSPTLTDVNESGEIKTATEITNNKRFEEMDIDPIRSSTLTELAATENETCISILMPTHQTGRETRQDPIRLSNPLDQVHEH